jgi:hypothetical protein
LTDLEWKSPREGVINARKLAGGLLLVIQAEDVRRTATGQHAKVTVALAEAGASRATPIVSDVLNLDKESYRHDFVNVLYGAGARSNRKAKFTDEFIEAYGRAEFERDLYKFSEEFYTHLMGTVNAGYVKGDPNKTEIETLVEHLILFEGGTVIYAPPKSVKSYLCMLLAVSVDAGVNKFFNVKQARVMYVNLERGKQSMQRRLGLINRVLGLPADRPLLMLNERGKRLADVYDAAKKMSEEEGVKVIFLDSLTRGGFGDLNGNEEANRAMDYLNRLCPAWVAIAHTPRQDDSHIFGSQMFDAAMDIGINVRRQKKDDGTVGVGLVVKETNDTGSPPMRVLAFEFDQFGLSQVRDAQRHEFPEIEESQTSTPRTNADRILDQFLAFGRMSVTQVSEDLRMNNGTVYTEVSKLVSEGKLIEVGKEGRSKMYGVPSTNSEGQN